MHNIHVTANYKIAEEWYNSEHSHVEDYSALNELCVASFKKNLVGATTFVTLTRTVATQREMFYDIFLRVRELHLEGNNILFTDSDTLCVKPTEIFGKFELKLNMFYSMPSSSSYPSSVPKTLYAHLTPWFMSNVRYFPYDMDKKLWEIGEDIAYHWIDVWAYECIVYNTMFHRQGIAKEDMPRYCIPQFNYQNAKGFTNLIKMEEAHIIHFHGSKGTKEVLQKMKSIGGIE